MFSCKFKIVEVRFRVLGRVVECYSVLRKVLECFGKLRRDGACCCMMQVFTTFYGMFWWGQEWNDMSCYLQQNCNAQNFFMNRHFRFKNPSNQ